MNLAVAQITPEGWPKSVPASPAHLANAAGLSDAYTQRTMASSLPQTEGRKLKLFQASDPFKQWWSLDEMRFCARCEHLFLGREIRLSEDEEGTVFFHCPTPGCEGGWADWQYPELHL